MDGWFGSALLFLAGWSTKWSSKSQPCPCSEQELCNLMNFFFQHYVTWRRPSFRPNLCPFQDPFVLLGSSSLTELMSRALNVWQHWRGVGLPRRAARAMFWRAGTLLIGPESSGVYRPADLRDRGLASPPSHETLDAIFHMLSNRLLFRQCSCQGFIYQGMWSQPECSLLHHRVRSAWSASKDLHVVWKSTESFEHLELTIPPLL